MRKKLIEGVRGKGITDESVLDAMMRVPRHFFFDKAFIAQAYSDHAFQIGAGQTISQPYTVAYQTSLLKIQKGDKVLEIGTGAVIRPAYCLRWEQKFFRSKDRKNFMTALCRCCRRWGIMPSFFMVTGLREFRVMLPSIKSSSPAVLLIFRRNW